MSTPDDIETSISMADQDAGGGDNEDRLKSLFDEPDAADGPLGDSQERRTIFAALDSF